MTDNQYEKQPKRDSKVLLTLPVTGGLQCAHPIHRLPLESSGVKIQY